MSLKIPSSPNHTVMMADMISDRLLLSSPTQNPKHFLRAGKKTELCTYPTSKVMIRTFAITHMHASPEKGNSNENKL